ncbi:MAG: hypothetical protein MZV63_34240 [Marinilabiliales bacterium]|nr:hypothetical protein [Marinilabiliales bacterium]
MSVPSSLAARQGRPCRRSPRRTSPSRRPSRRTPRRHRCRLTTRTRLRPRPATRQTTPVARTRLSLRILNMVPPNPWIAASWPPVGREAGRRGALGLAARAASMRAPRLGDRPRMVRPR